MSRKAFEFLPAGGVDSRANPINEPLGRYLRLRNFVPKPNGELDLRDGYTEVIKSETVATPIHSMIPYTDVTGAKFLLYWQGTVPKVMNMTSFLVFTPVIKGTAIAASDRFAYALASNGHLLAFNGTDKKWFDGLVWRDVGLPVLADTDVSGVVITAGPLGLTDAQASPFAFTFAAGGNWPGDDSTGEYIYGSIFYPTTGQLGPWVKLGDGSRQIGLTGQKLNFTGAPTLTNGAVVLLGASRDGTNDTNMLSARGSGTIGQTATSLPAPCSMTVTTGVVTVLSTAHGLATGDIVYCNVTAGLIHFSGGPFKVTVTDADHFTFTPLTVVGLYNGSTAVIYQLLTASAGTIKSYQWIVNGISVSFPGTSSLATSAVGGAQPGYQFYLSIYNPTTGHVGNRIAIGARLANKGPTSPIITGLPLLTDPEWVLLIGRTGDGGEIPYVITDAVGNWITIPFSQTSLVLTFGLIDGSKEMPTRNGVPPAFRRVWREGEKLCGNLDSSPFVYRSASEASLAEGDFVGVPDQSWAPNDVETMPSAEALTLGAGYNQESWCLSEGNLGILQESAGILIWNGPYNLGASGQFAWTIGWNNLPYWLTHDKQLGSTGDTGPIAVSEEYDSALLDQILLDSDEEIVYLRDPKKRLDMLLVKALDTNGSPFIVVHDFSMREANSPLGQGYEWRYNGPLAQDFTLCYVRDVNGKGKVWAGASNGKIYELFSGANDAGTEFLADWLALIYAGPYNGSITQVEWYGDENLKLFWSRNMESIDDTSSFESLSDDTPRNVPGEEVSPHYVVAFTGPQGGEFTHAYLWGQLQSHSTDGDMELSVPVHLPLEVYGRIYAIVPIAGPSRDK